jgi:hypothetical protein
MISYHQEAKTMTKRYNEPNYSFIIETSTPEGLYLYYWRIDQVLVNPGNDAAIDRLCNQVNRHLNALNKRLGLSFGIVVEGPLEEVDLKIENFGYNIS